MHEDKITMQNYLSIIGNETKNNKKILPNIKFEVSHQIFDFLKWANTNSNMNSRLTKEDLLA